MRPHDIVVLLKIISFADRSWLNKDLANDLYISFSEISESLNRSYIAGLLDYDKKKVHRQSLMEFLEHGLHYVFPQQPGSMVNGMATAHSHSYMRKIFNSDTVYVWPEVTSRERGLAIEPLYPNQPKAAMGDEKLYLLLALIDVIRVGRVREIHEAINKIKIEILNESPR